MVTDEDREFAREQNWDRLIFIVLASSLTQLVKASYEELLRRVGGDLDKLRQVISERRQIKEPIGKLDDWVPSVATSEEEES